jgi:hypothetical protein
MRQRGGGAPKWLSAAPLLCLNCIIFRKIAVYYADLLFFDSLKKIRKFISKSTRNFHDILPGIYFSFRVMLLLKWAGGKAG